MTCHHTVNDSVSGRGTALCQHANQFTLQMPMQAPDAWCEVAIM